MIRGFPRERVSSVPVGKCESDDGEDEDRDDRDVPIDARESEDALDGVVGEVDVWGMRKLAYPIWKKNEGYYVVIQFEASPTLPKELDRRLKISDVVMRHIIVNKDQR